MEKPQKAVDAINLQLSGNLCSRSLRSHDDLIVEHKQRQRQQQKKWQDTVDPLKLALDEVIGRGAFSIVYKGLCNGRTVAGNVLELKVLDFGDKGIKKALMDSMKNDFIKEVGLWQNLDHPNVTKMMGATMSMKMNSGNKSKTSRTESNFCIVSEYLKGGTLRSYLLKNQKNKLPMKTILQFALDIAIGLSYLHSKKIIHRDVKPDNMLMDKRQKIKLADFGVSVFEHELLFCMSGEAGTRGYTAPEVICRKAYGHICDVYGFGICLWEIYCCDMAYPDVDFDNISTDIYKKMRPQIPVNCPKSLAGLMERCWDKDPWKRPEMKDVVDELKQIKKSMLWQTSSEDLMGVFGCFGHGG